MTRTDLRRARHFIKSQEWRFARTMPQWPHWYIVGGKGNQSRQFNRFANLIKEYGEEDRWGRHTLCFLRIDSYKYWVMGEIINRAAPIPSTEVLRRGKEWLRRHGKKIGPYGYLISVGKNQIQKEETKGKRPADRISRKRTLMPSGDVSLGSS